MTEAANWPAYFFAISGGVLVVMQIVKGITRQPPIEAEFATKQEVKDGLRGMGGRVDDVAARVDRAIERLSEKLDARMNDLLMVDERRTKAIHERINELSAMVARLDERTNGKQ